MIFHRNKIRALLRTISSFLFILYVRIRFLAARLFAFCEIPGSEILPDSVGESKVSSEIAGRGQGRFSVVLRLRAGIFLDF